MSDLEVQTPPSAVPDTPGLSQWQRVTNTFTAPSKTFLDIKRGNRSWWMPFIITAIASYILFAAVATKIGMATVVENQIHMDPKSEERMAQLPPDQRETSNKIAVGVTQGVFIANPLLALAGFAVMSLGLWGTINFVFGGKASYPGIFATFMYASLPSIVKVLLGVIVIYVGGMAPESFNIKNFAPTNFGAFLNPMETNKALYSFASSIDIVTFWWLAVLAIGTATVAGVKRSSGYIAVFGWWAIIVLVGVGWAAAMG